MIFRENTNEDTPHVQVEGIDLPELETAFNDFILEVRKQIIAVDQVFFRPPTSGGFFFVLTTYISIFVLPNNDFLQDSLCKT